MSGSAFNYVRSDSHGVLRVGRGSVPLDSIVAAFDQGHTAETIREQYPALALEEVYGAIAYYLGHRAEVESYLRRQDGEWQKWRSRSESSESPARSRLRTQRHAQT